MEENNELIHVKALDKYLAQTGAPMNGRWGEKEKQWVLKYLSKWMNRLSLKYRQKC